MDNADKVDKEEGGKVGNCRRIIVRTWNLEGGAFRGFM